MKNITLNQLNSIVNIPDIAKHTGFSKGYIDMSKFFDNDKNVGLITQAGAMLFIHIRNSVYEVHFLLFKRCHGRHKYLAAKLMLQEMFTKYKASVIKGKPPRDNRAVRTLGVALGFRKIENSEHIDQAGRVCDIYELRSS